MKKLLVLLAGLAALLPLTAPGAHAAAPGRQLWAFCGIEPGDPYVVAKTSAMQASGITATFGPCRPAPAGYSPAYPGTRYADPATYYQLTNVNALFGLKTVVYDSRLWSANSSTRAIAKNYWQPQLNLGRVAAFDLGDEYDPLGPQWSILVSRWNTVRALGLKPYTNVAAAPQSAGATNLTAPYVAASTLAGIGSTAGDLSFDNYDYTQEAAVASAFNGAGREMCAVAAINFPGGPAVSPSYIAAAFSALLANGCDDWLIFTGELPQTGWTQYSLFDSVGNRTALSYAVAAAP